MKTLLLFFIGILSTTSSLSQTQQHELDLILKKKDCDNIRIRHMDNGDFLVFTAKYNSNRHISRCHVIDQDGQIKGSYKGKNLKSFIDKYHRDQEMFSSGSSMATRQVNENKIYHEGTGKMYRLINHSSKVTMKEISHTGEVSTYKYTNDQLLKSMLLTSWDMKMFGKDIIRSLLLYNHWKERRVTLVSLDYNIRKKTFTTRTHEFPNGLLGFSGYDRPNIKMVNSTFEDRMFCVVNADKINRFCLLNMDLSVDYLDTTEVLTSFPILNDAYIETVGKKSFLIFSNQSFFQSMDMANTALQSNKSIDICSIEINEMNDVPYAISKQIHIPPTKPYISIEEYKNQLEFLITPNDKVLLHFKKFTTSYSLSDTLTIVEPEDEKMFPRNLGNNVSPLGFNGEKIEPFLKNDVLGYSFRKNNDIESALLPFTQAKNRIGFRLIQW